MFAVNFNIFLLLLLLFKQTRRNATEHKSAEWVTSATSEHARFAEQSKAVHGRKRRSMSISKCIAADGGGCWTCELEMRRMQTKSQLDLDVLRTNVNEVDVLLKISKHVCFGVQPWRNTQHFVNKIFGDVFIWHISQLNVLDYSIANQRNKVCHQLVAETFPLSSKLGQHTLCDYTQSPADPTAFACGN